MSKRLSNASSSSRESGAAPQMMYRSDVGPVGRIRGVQYRGEDRRHR